MENVIKERVLLHSILSNSALWNEKNYEVIQFITERLNTGLFSTIPIRSYSSCVYLLSFKKETQKFILKIRAVDSSLKLGVEVTAFKALSEKIIVPELVLYGTSLGYEVAIYYHLGTSTNNQKKLLCKETINSIWKLILVIQNTLLVSSDSLNLHLENSKKYATEIHRYTLKYVGKEIPLKDIEVLDERLRTSNFNDSITVFSDRGPVNWIINKKGITPIDFDLLLLEPCLADFIQFIDHHELYTPYDRNTLIDMCLAYLGENSIFFTKEDFHWHALYRNLIQGAVFYKVSREISLFHYKKALYSSHFLNEVLLEKHIKKILKEVAWI